MLKRLRICFNSWSGAFFNPGGGEVQLLESKKALEVLGHEVLFYNQWAPQKDIDVFHQFSTEDGAEAALRHYRSIGVKTAFSPIIWGDFSPNTHIHHRIQSLLNLSNVVFSNSTLENQRLLRDFDVDKNKLFVTRNSIQECFLSLGDEDYADTRYKLPSEFVLSVANIDKRKNTKAVIQAVTELGLNLVLVGSVRDEEYFNSLNLAMYKNVIFLGPVYDVKLLKSLYRRAALFFLPSWCETPGIAALEALSQGCKLVITDCGPTEEYFKEFAEYVSPSSLESQKQGILRALSRSSDSASQIRFVTDNFIWSKTAEEILKGYEFSQRKN